MASDRKCISVFGRSQKMVLEKWSCWALLIIIIIKIHLVSLPYLALPTYCNILFSFVQNPVWFVLPFSSRQSNSIPLVQSTIPNSYQYVMGENVNLLLRVKSWLTANINYADKYT